ncbi:Protein zgrf1, partial [Coemansia sp. RSA 518]
SERDIIIISCVRSEKIGFIANPNRVNVALSRARHHCLVVGSRKLLQTNGMWKCVIEECKGERLGVGDAQVLVNHVASVAAQSVQCGGVDGLAEVVDIDHLSEDDLAEDDLDKDNLFKVHLSEDELDN